MAVKEVAQHPIDLGSAIANGNPLAVTDATHVSTVSADVQPVGSVDSAGSGTLFLAAAIDHAHQGVHSIKSNANPQLFGDVEFDAGSGITLTQVGNVITIAASGQALNKITLGEDSERSNVGVTEEVVYEYNVNFDDAGAGAGPNIQVRLSALVAATAGVGTFNVRVGGTIGVADGTTRATITAVAPGFAQATNLGAAFANPGGQQLVKITAANSAALNINQIRGTEISIG